MFEKGVTKDELSQLKEETFVEVTGFVEPEERAPHGVELRLTGVRILSWPEAPVPIAVSKWKMGASLEARLDMRPLTLRNVRERARFKIEEGIARAFREFLQGEGFTEIHTPKIGARGAEGGANVFKLDYFHRPAVLAQSPQFYKQMMVGVFDRVMEIGPVFRAEKHNTKRHLNEYTGLDFELGYIDDFTDIMAMETGFFSIWYHCSGRNTVRNLDYSGQSCRRWMRFPVLHLRRRKSWRLKSMVPSLKTRMIWNRRRSI